MDLKERAIEYIESIRLTGNFPPQFEGVFRKAIKDVLIGFIESLEEEPLDKNTFKMDENLDTLTKD